MNKLFRVYNKSRRGMWVIAGDEQQAKELALAAKFVKKIDNVIRVDDQTDQFLADDTSGPSLQEILEDDARIGQAAMNLPVMQVTDFFGPVVVRDDSRHTTWILANPL